jgi:hypothetical protein
MKRILILHCPFICLLLLAAAGCSTPQQTASNSPVPEASNHKAMESKMAKAEAPISDSAALQGTWTGKELSADSDDPCRLIVSGQNFEFHGPDAFTLREDSNPKVMVAAITECPVEKYVGKTDYALYRLENGTLMLTAREPGNPDMPANFDAPETRRFMFKRK